MRVIICTMHNVLMEAKAPNSVYVVCFKCDEKRINPSWFPARLAYINHVDGAMRRTWVYNLRWMHWERKKDD